MDRDEIEDLEFENLDGWIEDSTIAVYTIDGDWFVLLLSAEGQRDDDFYFKLRRRWQPGRGASVPGAPQ